VQISPDDIKKLHGRLGPNYGEFPRLLMRWAALFELYRALGRFPLMNDDILSDLMDPGLRASATELPGPADLEAINNFVPPAAGPEARNLALFFPKGQDAMSSWTLARFYQTVAKFGSAQAYRHVLCEAYDADQPFGAPFQIGESCSRVGAHAALVLGPPHESKLAARVGEFAHAVRHILESFGVAMGWVPFSETTITRPFLAAQLDFMTFPQT